ncbi:HDOD domain-containing protein [Noviherbaspirillum aerium]|uniref:HDOD domain-containing protein n=1 Tax=Noviherbaspirillum aerium TaxID=2588497 RepID=UPI00124EA6CB|nr:HDOD domain-containing protein [Noviherbaspirillum aerium]
MNAPSHKEPVNPDKTMELLWSRVRQRGDLPGFSKVVGAILGAMRGDDDREFNMTRTVLQDPALTQKVLRLANSAMYSVFGQGINTVSKAVMVLGTEAIGHLALGLKLVDGLSSASSESANARAEMQKSVLAGHIARQLASSASTRDAEEAVVCSMLHSLGRMMTTFYLADRWQQVLDYCVRTGADEDAGVQAVLGLGLDEIGRRAARQWGLPAAVVETMRDIEAKDLEEPLDHKDWLVAMSTVSTRCSTLLASNNDNAYVEAGLAALAGDYAEMLGLEPSQMLTAVDAAQRNAAAEDSVAVHQRRRNDPGVESAASQTKFLPEPAKAGKPADAAALLTRGVADLRGALPTASAGQLLTMALETVHQGLAFSRTIAFLRDREKSRYAAHMYFGDGLQELLSQLVFGDAYQPDVFHAALANDKMIFVENAQNSAFASKVPRWWRDALPTVRSFTVLPLTLNRQPIGFIYGDWDMSTPPARIEQAEVVPLNELRTMVMQGLARRRVAEPAWTRNIL